MREDERVVLERVSAFLAERFGGEGVAELRGEVDALLAAASGRSPADRLADAVGAALAVPQGYRGAVAHGPVRERLVQALKGHRSAADASRAVPDTEAVRDDPENGPWADLIRELEATAAQAENGDLSGLPPTQYQGGLADGYRAAAGRARVVLSQQPDAAAPSVARTDGQPPADVDVVLRKLADDLETRHDRRIDEGHLVLADGLFDALDMVRSRIGQHPRRSAPPAVDLASVLRGLLAEARDLVQLHAPMRDDVHDLLRRIDAATTDDAQEGQR